MKYKRTRALRTFWAIIDACQKQPSPHYRRCNMKIAFVHPFLYRFARGIERFTFNIANALVRQGVDIHLITWRWPHPVEIDVLEPRVRVHFVPTPRYYANKAVVPFYIWHLLREQYDFVWIYFAGYGEAEALNFVRRQHFGIVFHYPYAQVPHRYREFKKSRLAQRADQIVSVSQYVADGVRESLGRDSVIIHHGVDTNRFRPDPSMRARVRHSLGLASTTPLLVTAAALEERKGIQWVLRALHKVLEIHPDTMYLVLGDGPYRPSLEELAHTLNVNDHVRFLGAQADVVPFLQAADISLILARGEASSLTTLESMACGVPVVTAKRPPFDELIQPSWGQQVIEKNIQQLAMRLLQLLSNRELCFAMGAAGRQCILEQYTWSQVARRYLEIGLVEPKYGFLDS